MKTIPATMLLGVLFFTACGQKPSAETAVVSAPAAAPVAAPTTIRDNFPASLPAPPVSVEARIAEWKLQPADMADEMEHDRRVVRMRAPTDPLPQYAKAEAMEAFIKQRLHDDPALASIDFRVDVERVVATLNGAANSPQQIGRAMAIALGIDGISEVISELTLPETRIPTDATAVEMPHG